MSNIYLKGITSFNPHEKAPDFVLGTVIFNIDEVISSLQDLKDYYTGYKGKAQLKTQAVKGEYGISFKVDTWKSGENRVGVDVAPDDDDLPF